jgi:putative transposase
MIAMTVCVTMLGLSRWTEKGGSYRTEQRFFYTVTPWAQVYWTFFREHLVDRQDTYLLAGDECIVTKAGKKTHGLDCFFSSLLKQAVPRLTFFTLTLVSTKQRRSYPVSMEQMVCTAEEKAAIQAKKQAKKVKPEGPKRKPGRLNGSRNKGKAEVVLNPKLQRIQKMLNSFLDTIQGTIQLTYLVLDGHFINHSALNMVRQCQLHLISKLR